MSSPVHPTLREQLQAFLLAAICAVLYLGSSLLPGRALLPYAPECAEPMRSEALASGVSAAELERGNLSMGDKFHQSLTWDRVLHSRLQAGEFPMWTRDIGGGAPFAPQMGQPYQPWNLLLYLLPSVEWYGPVVLLQLVLIGWFAYRFLRRVGCVHVSALLGLVCVVLGLWMQGRIHQNVVISAALPLFLMLSCVHDLFCVNARNLRTVGVLGLAAGLSWLGGFAPVSLQVSYLTMAFALTLALACKHWRPLIPVGCGMAIGALLALAQMGPTLLAAAESARETANAADLIARRAGFANAFGVFWPDLLFWPDPGALTGKQSVAALLAFDHELITSSKPNYTELVFSVGFAASIAMSGLLQRWRDSEIARPENRGWFIALFATVGLVAFFATTAVSPFLELTAVIPGARAGDLRRFFFLVYVALAVLAAFGADRLRAAGAPWMPLVVITAIVVPSAIVLVMHLRSEPACATFYAERLASAYSRIAPVTPEQVLALFSPGEVAANRSHVLGTTLRTVLIGGVAILVLLRFRRWSVPVLCALAIVELLHAGWGNRLALDADRITTPPRVLEPVLEATAQVGDKPRPRMMNFARPIDLVPRGLVVANLPGFWGVEHLGAYNPLPKRRMEELWLAIEPDREGKRSVVIGGAGVDALYDPASIDHPMLDVLGVDWILASAESGSSRLADATPSGVPSPFKLYRRRGALPRATFIDSTLLVPDREERLALLGDRSRDPRREIVLESEFAPMVEGDGIADASVEVELHADERVVVLVENREPGYLRLADPYDAGWTAHDGDRSLEVFVADHYLRAVYLEPGRHEIEFRFDAARVWLPRWVAAAAVLAILVMIAVGSRRRLAPRPT